jgi:YbbR domain-containing protein
MHLVRSFFSGFTTLLLAIILAVVIWATAIRVNDPVEAHTLEVPVTITGKEADAEVIGVPPESVLINLQGPVSALDQLSPADFTATIDLSNVPYGDIEVPIQVEGGAEFVDILSVFPESAQLQLEQIVTREIPVDLQIRGEVARGHRIVDPRVEPDTIQVTGPADRVDQISESRVIMFVDNDREDISEPRRPTFYDMRGDVASTVGLTLNPREVDVIIPVQELAGFAEKPITVDWIGEPAPGYRLLDVKVEPSSINVTGAPGILEGLRIQTEPIDITGMDETTTQQMALDLPEGVGLVELQPILVTVEIEPILTSSVVQKQVEVRALREGLEAILDPEEVRVFLFGPLPTLDSLADDDVRVTVDLLNIITGTHVVEPFVSVSADEVEVRSTQPPQISVIISGTVTDTLEPPISSLGFGSLLTLERADDEGQAGQQFFSPPVAMLPIEFQQVLKNQSKRES